VEFFLRKAVISEVRRNTETVNLRGLDFRCRELETPYGVATISRLLKMIGLFCRILSLLWVSFAKETYHFKEPTHRSHPITLSKAYCNKTSIYAQVCMHI